MRICYSYALDNALGPIHTYRLRCYFSYRLTVTVCVLVHTSGGGGGYPICR